MVGRLRAATFARHAASLGGSRIAASILAAGWLVVAARQLPVHSFGDLSILLSVGAIMITVGDLGLPFVLADAVAGAGQVSWSTINVVLRRRLAVAAPTALVVGIAYMLVASDTRPVIPVVFTVSLLSTAVYSTLTAAMRGLAIFAIEATNEVGSRIGVLAAGSFLLARGGGLLAAVSVYALADAVSAVVVTAVVARHVSAEDGIDRTLLTSRRHAHMAAGRFLAVFYYRVDLWLIALLRGSAAAAGYGAPYRLLDGALLLPRAMGAVAVTHAGRRRRTDQSPQSPTAITLGAAGVAAAVAIPAMVLAGPIMRLTFGPRYVSSASVLVVLMASAVPGAIASTLIPLAGVGHGKRFAATVGALFVTNVVLNLALIPPFGPMAAAWNTLLCQSVLAGLLYRILASSARPVPSASQTISSIRSSASLAH